MLDYLILRKPEIPVLFKDRAVEVVRKVSPPFGKREDWSINRIRLSKYLDASLRNRDLLDQEPYCRWGVAQALKAGVSFSVPLSLDFTDTVYLKENWSLSYVAGLGPDDLEVTVHYPITEESREFYDVPRSVIDSMRFPVKKVTPLPDAGEGFRLIETWPVSSPSFPLWAARAKLRVEEVIPEQRQERWRWRIRVKLLRKSMARVRYKDHAKKG